MALSDFGHMLSVGAVCFEDRFCASKKRWDRGRWDRGRWTAWGAVHMAAAWL